MSLAKILGKQKGKQSYKADDRLVLPDCPIGMEFEYEGVLARELPEEPSANHWQYHEERSLKDNGAEYVFAVPLFGADCIDATAWLMNYAKGQQWKCTKRTGIHVHVDVRDLEVAQLAGMCMVYAAMEPILYRWVGDARDVSHFCIPLYQSEDALSKTAEIVRMAMLDQRSGGRVTSKLAEGFGRYAGFNLNALHKFGSVEFRQLQTTHDQQRVFDWINMCMSIKDAAFKLPHSDGSVIQMLEEMQAIEAIYYIFGRELAEKLITLEMDRDFRVGLESARDIAVHGTQDGWVSVKAPLGEHAGYNSWRKSGKKIKINPIVDEDEDDLVDFEADGAEPAAVLDDPGIAVPAAAQRDNWVNGFIFNQPPPGDPQPGRIDALRIDRVREALRQNVPPRPRRR